MDKNLIYDIGMCDGEDTAYYLHKGYKVVGIEPSPLMIMKNYVRFREELIAEKLYFVHAAVGTTYKMEQFFTVPREPGLDRLLQNAPASEFVVPTYSAVIPLTAVLDRFGTPYYLKIDTEGNEAAILAQLNNRELPAYISSEAHSEEPVKTMYNLGYRKFKITLHDTTRGPICANEPNWKFQFLSSGPFGENLPGDWVDIGAVLAQRANVYLTGVNWADVHAKL